MENASLTELEFETGAESSDDYTESPQLAVPTRDTHRTRNFHYPPPETMTPTVNLMLYSFSSFSSGLFNRSNVILKGLDCRVQHFFKLRQCYADLCTNPPSCRVSSSHHPLANYDPIYFEMQERLEEGRHGAGGGSASGKTLSLAHVAVIWARDLHTDMCWKLRLDKAGD
ncbi:uncharacterized protein ARMOST_10319 [Armillaria ostoyae]|uniref:Uncharacterized protein n=1 Tax=Armillaria ostoyae TaxID=47428 RepID=A0A284RDY1_ARMOS|nr:uncharacterized protein ARMOST_10319 [Armillaria ostoyae]